MTRDIIAILGIDGAVWLILSLTEPDFCKKVLWLGFLSLLGIFLFTRQGRISIYGSQLMMGITIYSHYT